MYRYKMNIKNSLKISANLRYMSIFLIVSFVILFISCTVTFILAVFEEMFFSSEHVFFPLVPTYILILFLNFYAFWFIDKMFSINSNKIKKYLKTTEDEQIILYHLFNKPHHSSKLNLELQKISKAVENKSSLYQELNETDFPYLNKLFRRLNCLQAAHNNNNIKNISTNDLNKLNISNPMLLTFEQVDNELNNLINQNILNQNKKCVKTMIKR